MRRADGEVQKRGETKSTVDQNNQESCRKYRATCLLVRLHRSLIGLLYTAFFACALHRAHLLARWLTHSLPSS